MEMRWRDYVNFLLFTDQFKEKYIFALNIIQQQLQPTEYIKRIEYNISSSVVEKKEKTLVC